MTLATYYPKKINAFHGTYEKLNRGNATASKILLPVDKINIYFLIRIKYTLVMFLTLYSYESIGKFYASPGITLQVTDMDLIVLCKNTR